MQCCMQRLFWRNNPGKRHILPQHVDEKHVNGERYYLSHETPENSTTAYVTTASTTAPFGCERPSRLLPVHDACLESVHDDNYITATMSSILRIIPTHSVANFNELEFTNTGWITCSAYMSLMVPLRTLIPGSGIRETTRRGR